MSIGPMANDGSPEVEPDEASAPLALSALRALEQDPTPAGVAKAINVATSLAQVIATASVTDAMGLAAIQILRARIEALCGEPQATLSSEVALQLARNISNGDQAEQLLVEALLCAARNQRSANQLNLARLRAAEALAVAQVRFGGSDLTTAVCWRELGEICEVAGDVTGAQAAYREAFDADPDGTASGRSDQD